jgi:G:T/U-mismatch repair DNA glycosylase
VNLVDRPTIDVTELKKGEEQAGVRRALRIIRIYRPKVVRALRNRGKRNKRLLGRKKPLVIVLSSRS